MTVTERGETANERPKVSRIILNPVIVERGKGSRVGYTINLGDSGSRKEGSFAGVFAVTAHKFETL